MSAGMGNKKTIRQALQYVDDNPEWPATPRLDMPVWELVARNLFDIANNPDSRVVGSINKSTRAQRIILDRLTGTRRVGTHPAVRNSSKIDFVDLTTHSIAPMEAEDDEGDSTEAPQ
jgi:hypothetical protein